MSKRLGRPQVPSCVFGNSVRDGPGPTSTYISRAGSYPLFFIRESSCWTLRLLCRFIGKVLSYCSRYLSINLRPAQRGRTIGPPLACCGYGVVRSQGYSYLPYRRRGSKSRARHLKVIALGSPIDDNKGPLCESIIATSAYPRPDKLTNST